MRWPFFSFQPSIYEDVNSPVVSDFDFSTDEILFHFWSCDPMRDENRLNSGLVLFLTIFHKLGSKLAIVYKSVSLFSIFI